MKALRILVSSKAFCPADRNSQRVPALLPNVRTCGSDLVSAPAVRHLPSHLPSADRALVCAPAGTEDPDCLRQVQRRKSWIHRIGQNGIRSPTTSLGKPWFSAPKIIPAFKPRALTKSTPPAALTRVSPCRADVRLSRERLHISDGAFNRLEHFDADAGVQTRPQRAVQPPHSANHHGGATRRNSCKPKFSITRAAEPIFSPSCGRCRMIMGRVIPEL